MVEVYVRGNSIKYVTIPEEVLDMVQEEDLSKESELTKNIYVFCFVLRVCFLALGTSAVCARGRSHRSVPFCFGIAKAVLQWQQLSTSWLCR